MKNHLITGELGLEEFFSQIPNYNTYNIFLNGEKLNKPYSDEFEISRKIRDRIKAIKKLTFTNTETGEIIGLGWFAITSFKSSFPKSLTMRGVRIRHGNIEIGDERFLDHIYTERRFATWHIGEIHLNHNIKPNARRDGFEESTDYERFLERATFIGKGLSKLCRDSSSNRSINQRAIAEISQIEKTIRPSFMVFDSQHHNKVIDETNSKLESLTHLANSKELDESTTKKLNELNKRVKITHFNKMGFSDLIDGRKIESISKKKLIQIICKRIVDLYDKDQPIEVILENVLKPYINNKNSKQYK